MPLRKQGTFNRSLIALAVAGAALMAPAAASAASCPEQPTTKAFSGYGDSADYALAPSGNFEGSTNGWTFKNSKVVSGNGGLVGSVLALLGGKQSVALASGFMGGGEVVSPEFCVDSSHPYFRYMMKANGAVGQLRTYVRYKATDGSTKTTEVKSLVSTTLLPSLWKPSALNPLSVNIPLVQNSGTSATVQLVFQSSFTVLGAGYQIDNVLIDPYRRG